MGTLNNISSLINGATSHSMWAGTSNTVTSTGSPYVYGTSTFYENQATITLTGQVIHDLGEDGISFQHEIAVLKVTRNESGKIIKSKMIKTFWVETHNQGSIDYAASKDPEVNKFEPEEIIIKTLRTIKL
jgi:hypothetical protein